MEARRGTGGLNRRRPHGCAAQGRQYNVELDLRRVADRYRTLLEFSVQLGVVRNWKCGAGPRPCRSHEPDRLRARGSRPCEACGLLDVLHIFKGGSNFAGIRVFNGDALHVLHMNDYPAEYRAPKGY